MTQGGNRFSICSRRYSHPTVSLCCEVKCNFHFFWPCPKPSDMTWDLHLQNRKSQSISNFDKGFLSDLSWGLCLQYRYSFVSCCIFWLWKDSVLLTNVFSFNGNVSLAASSVELHHNIFLLVLVYLLFELLIFKCL